MRESRPPSAPCLAAQILVRQRAAFLQDGPPSLTQRRADLKKLRAAILARRMEVERAADADFGHRSRHETALELGGKSPAIVAPGCADDRTAACIAFGKLANAGQTCIAPDYVMIPRTRPRRSQGAYSRAVKSAE